MLEEKDLKNSVQKSLKSFEQNFSNKSVLYNNALYDSNVQKFLLEKSDKNFDVVKTVLNYEIINAEKKCAGAGELLLNLVINCLSDDLKHFNNFNVCKYDFDKALKNLAKTSLPCSKNDFEAFTKENIDNKTAKQIINQVLDLYKVNDQISIKKGNAQETTIKRSTGCLFTDVTVNQNYLDKDVKLAKRKNVNVIIYDGIIESVGAVYHLLEKAAADKQPYLLLVHGIFDEVNDVIIKNYLHNIVDVIVVSYKHDEFNINFMTDMGLVCNCEPIRAENGGSISQFILHDIPMIDSFCLTDKTIEIFNKQTELNVKKMLIELYDRCNNDIDQQFLLQKRIQNLSNYKIVVRIGTRDVRQQNNVIELIDSYFRLCPQVFLHGFNKKDDIQNKIDERISHVIFGSRSIESYKKISTAVQFYKSIREQITKLSVAVMLQY